MLPAAELQPIVDPAAHLRIFTLGMHAGYAIYFPELFPTHLRATGTSFCFNGGRLVAVPVLLFSGWLKGQETVNLNYALSGST
ncbi:MAG: hypothetical protein R3C11_10295 [Planctomycetaceae bacterium]